MYKRQNDIQINSMADSGRILSGNAGIGLVSMIIIIEGTMKLP